MSNRRKAKMTRAQVGQLAADWELARQIEALARNYADPPAAGSLVPPAWVEENLPALAAAREAIRGR